MSYNLDEFGTTRDFELDDGDGKYYGGHFRSYNPNDGTAEWYSPSKIIIKILKRDPNWKGFLRYTSIDNPHFDRKLKNGLICKVSNYMDADKKEKKMKLVSQQTIKSSNSEVISTFNQNVTDEEIAQLNKDREDYIKLINNVSLDLIKQKTEANPDQWYTISERIKTLFDLRHFFKYNDELYEKMDLYSLGIEQMKFVNLQSQQLISSSAILKMILDNDFELLNLGDCFEFGKKIPDIDKTTNNYEESNINKNIKKKKRKPSKYQPGSPEYIKNQFRLRKIKLGYSRNRNLEALVLNNVIMNNFVKRWWSVYFDNQSFNSDLFHVVYIPSHGGKSTLTNNFSHLFCDIDDLLTEEEKRKFRFKLEKEIGREYVDYDSVNLYWQKKVAQNYHLIKNKILLAHTPSQIPDHLKKISKELILLPDDFKSGRLFLPNLNHLLSLSLDKIICNRQLYLPIILCYFNLNIHIVKKTYLRHVNQ